MRNRTLSCISFWAVPGLFPYVLCTPGQGWMICFTFAKPRPMNVNEIKEMVKKWGETAYLCWKAGFDGVQGLTRTHSMSAVNY